MFFQSFALPLLGFCLGVQGKPVLDCPLFGPSFPAGVDIRDHQPFKDVVNNFPSLLEEEFKAGSLNKSGSIFIVDVFSAATNSSIFSHYFVGKDVQDNIVGGEVNDTTVSRIGSVSKIFTSYAILQQAGFAIFNDPVAKYIPELARNSTSRPLDHIPWDQVTVGSLMAQQGGAGGVPLESVNCPQEHGSCSISSFLEIMRNSKHPTEAAFQTPFYSDAGFAVLGRVLERLHGAPFQVALEDSLGKPLGLNSTSTSQPTNKNTNSIIVPGGPDVSTWGVDSPVTDSTGGVYTTAADLRRVGLSILNSELLSQIDTRRWLKPLGHTSSITFAVGAPWEIHSLALQVTPGSNRTRTLDLYTKLGGNAGYGGVLAISPDHGLGYVVMTAGSGAINDRYTLRILVGDVFLPAAEHTAFQMARRNYVGTFAHPEYRGTNLTLTVDEGFAGIGIESFYINGTDARILLGGPLSLAYAAEPFKVRIYQTGLTSNGSIASLYSQSPTAKFSYRVVLDFLPYDSQGPARQGKSMFMNECESWESVGFANGFDELILDVVDGRVEGVSHGLLLGEVLRRV